MCFDFVEGEGFYFCRFYYELVFVWKRILGIGKGEVEF